MAPYDWRRQPSELLHEPLWSFKEPPTIFGVQNLRYLFISCFFVVCQVVCWRFRLFHFWSTHHFILVLTCNLTYCDLNLLRSQSIGYRLRRHHIETKLTMSGSCFLTNLGGILYTTWLRRSLIKAVNITSPFHWSPIKRWRSRCWKQLNEWESGSRSSYLHLTMMSVLGSRKSVHWIFGCCCCGGVRLWWCMPVGAHVCKIASVPRSRSGSSRSQNWKKKMKKK